MKNSSDIEIRKLSCADSVADIAKYIYYTDDYIYPDMAESPESEEWIKFISGCLADKDNFIVALKNGRIIGLACVLECGKKLHLLNGEYEMSESFVAVYKGYFLPLTEEIRELDGYYISNICVDFSCRGCGIGRRLLRKVSEIYGNKITLDAIADNTVAVKLYESEGYTVTKEYFGYGGSRADKLLCVHMIKH